jgi:MoxR-like ATPase
MESIEIQQHEIAEIEEFANKRDTMLGEIRKVIIGQDRVIEEVLIALFARGHCLLVGVPGLAKTLLISTLAEILDLDFNRIQFTPDLMPSDITGTDILQEDPATGRRKFQFLRSIFTNILLADEINRTPPKTQAALLQSMQEYKVTAGGTTYPLDLPFFVLATQNPIEQEGTYPLPEAQLDRFMLNIEIRYPDFDDEVEIVMQTTSTAKPSPRKIMEGPAILRYQDLVRRVPVSPFVVSYAVALAQRSRPQSPDVPQFVKDYVERGAGPRASQYLILGAKARTILQGRYAVSIEGIQPAPSVSAPHRSQLQSPGRRPLVSRYHQPSTERSETSNGRQSRTLGFRIADLRLKFGISSASENSHAFQTHSVSHDRRYRNPWHTRISAWNSRFAGVAPDNFTIRSRPSQYRYHPPRKTQRHESLDQKPHVYRRHGNLETFPALVRRCHCARRFSCRALSRCESEAS